MARQKPSDHIETLKKQQAELAKKLKEAQTKARNEAKEFQRRKNELAGAVALRNWKPTPPARLPSPCSACSPRI